MTSAIRRIIENAERRRKVRTCHLIRGFVVGIVLGMVFGHVIRIYVG
jgi:F0F1-type ATP synthase assembly protein I